MLRLNGKMRAILIFLQVPLWLGLIVDGFVGTDMHVATALGFMAATGTVIGQLRESGSNGRTGNAARDAAEMVIQAVIASRSQPADAVLRLVGDGETRSAPQPQHPKAG